MGRRHRSAAGDCAPASRTRSPAVAAARRGGVPWRRPGLQAAGARLPRRQQPGRRAVLARRRRQLRLDFSESVVLERDPDRRRRRRGRHIARDRPAGVPRTTRRTPRSRSSWSPRCRRCRAAPTASPGETLSSDDLHRTSGVLVFGVGQAVTAAGRTSRRPRRPRPRCAGCCCSASPARWAARWPSPPRRCAGCRGAARGRRVGRRLARRCSGPAATATAAALLLLVTQLAAAGSRALPLLWSSDGLRWGLRELGLLALLGATLAPPHDSPGPAPGGRRSRPAPPSPASGRPCWDIRHRPVPPAHPGGSRRGPTWVRRRPGGCLVSSRGARRRGCAGRGAPGVGPGGAPAVRSAGRGLRRGHGRDRGLSQQRGGGLRRRRRWAPSTAGRSC